MTSRRKLEARLRRWYRYTAKGDQENLAATRGFEDAANRVARAHNKRVYRLQKLFYEEAFQQEWTELHDHQD